MELDSSTGPEITLRQISVRRDTATQSWHILWEVANQGRDGLIILTVRLPHGQFKSIERRFAPNLEVAAGAIQQFESLVQCDEPAGLVTENAFVIFHCQWHGEAWRIFVRIRVTARALGEPETAIELITTQRVGFSGLSD